MYNHSHLHSEIVRIPISLSKLEKKDTERGNRRRVTMEFHVSKATRDKYDIEDTFFSITGNVVFANFHATRVFAQKMNKNRDLVNNPEQAVKAGQLNALGLIDEILHYVADLYREQRDRKAFSKALTHLETAVGKEKLESALTFFVHQFPPAAVHRGDASAEEYLADSTEGISNKELALEELIMLWTANMNPAFNPFYELFDDTPLKTQTDYNLIMEELQGFFKQMPGFGPKNQDLITVLREPAVKVPDSLEGQLDWIRSHWGMLLGKYLFRLLSSLDLLKEEQKMGIPGGKGPLEAYEYSGMEEEAERFSPDKDWMPSVVILAKSTLVWLDQLSKEYGYEIRRLDQIPDKELDTIASRGFTGLWLIGLWERSQASRRVKQLCGNPEAESSAYSLYDYDIADSLGSWEGLNSLRQRCRQRGIRLASDMVPNHTGIDSKWVREHPDWFLQLDYPPYPNYSFNGENLSSEPGLGIYLEDHYYSREDAAVVFKRQDFNTGDVRYIYHGNDGTSMPWNDTAQLDFLNQETREAIIQTILHVARSFSIIRFDAAMTLAKKHFQRLWFPEPGSGGDIPTRSDFAMTKDEFNQAMPEEFWREVVDRVAEEVPDTLLLAEAFWFMEGYFVRTLGMHRVYNSAFMNMLKDEENAKYRNTIKNTLEFEPEILKRFVNFMNNPDEETAVAQFGKGDKYFGICIMMVTMPGLPMFGHGQVEGYAEKYGMEYTKAYWDEKPDWELVRRHEQEVFPLMKKRHLFSDVQNFLLYDFYTPEGHVNESVFAYSNSAGQESALVVYNNCYESTKGWIKTSTAFSEKTNGSEKRLSQRTLKDGIGVSFDENAYCILHEINKGMYFIRSSREIADNGMYFELNGYECQVFTDIYEVYDNDYGHYRMLASTLNGQGVPDINEALRAIFLRPLHETFERVLSVDLFNTVAESITKGKTVKKSYWDSLHKKAEHALNKARDFGGGNGNAAGAAQTILTDIKMLPKFASYITDKGKNGTGKLKKAALYLDKEFKKENLPYYTLTAWAAIRNLGRLIDAEDDGTHARSLFDEWLLPRQLRKLFSSLNVAENRRERCITALMFLTSHQEWLNPKDAQGKKRKLDAGTELKKILNDQDVSAYIGENRYNGILYFNKESFESLCWWLLAVGAFRGFSVSKTEQEADKTLKNLYAVAEKWFEAEDQSEYQIEKLLNQLEPETKKTSGGGKTSSSGKTGKNDTAKNNSSKAGGTGKDVHSGKSGKKS